VAADQVRLTPEREYHLRRCAAMGIATPEAWDELDAVRCELERLAGMVSELFAADEPGVVRDRLRAYVRELHL